MSYGQVRRAVAVVTLMCFFTGCYAQRPLAVAVPAPSTRIIAQVTDTGAVAMGNAIGPGALEVEGVVAEADAQTWKLHLVRVEQRGGTTSRWNHEVVSFPRNALTNAREKRLDKARSWLAAGLMAAVVVTLGIIFAPALGGEGRDGDPVPPA